MKRTKTTTFLLELPLSVKEQQAKHLRAHLEVARCFYNAVLGAARSRLQRMRDDPAWQATRALPRTHKQERNAAFRALRQQYGFSEYALHAYAKEARTSWIADHLDSTMAQTLATRAYRAVQRVCLGQAKQVRFRSQGRGLDSVEGKRNDTGMRFALQAPEEGQAGFLLWGKDQIPACIDWDDPVVAHGLRSRIKFVRLVRRRASSPQAKGADSQGFRYFVQLVLEGRPFQKPKHTVGTDTLGLDLGPSTLAMVPKLGPARLTLFGEQLRPKQANKRRLQRKKDRQRRANNPQNYDERGRIKKAGKQRLRWHESKQYQQTQRRYATLESKLAAHRKSLHGQLVNDLMRVGNRIQMEKTSFKGWQKRYGRSVGMRAPGMFVERLRRTVAKTGGTLSEVSTYRTRLSQYCHGCETYRKKPLSERWHHCSCGIGPVQRDLYSAFLLAYLNPKDLTPSIAQQDWAGAESRLRAAMEDLEQRAKEGQPLPRSFGIPGARARRPQSLTPSQQEPGSLASSPFPGSVGVGFRTPASSDQGGSESASVQSYALAAKYPLPAKW